MKVINDKGKQEDREMEEGRESEEGEDGRKEETLADVLRASK